MVQQNSILLFPDGAPGETEEMLETESITGRKVADCPVLRIRNVSKPTLTFYPAAADNNSRTTIIVNPGGRYEVLAYDLEGTEICERFNSHGINCVLVKYRVPHRKELPRYEAPLQDLQRAPELNVTDKIPPTFFVQTQDDHKLINSSLFYYYALKEAKVPVAMHLYPLGGHAYGLRNTGQLVNEWPDRVLDWLRDIGMLDR